MLPISLKHNCWNLTLRVEFRWISQYKNGIIPHHTKGRVLNDLNPGAGKCLVLFVSYPVAVPDKCMYTVCGWRCLFLCNACIPLKLLSLSPFPIRTCIGIDDSSHNITHIYTHDGSINTTQRLILSNLHQRS